MNLENVRSDRKTRKGVVVSNKMDKTVIVKVTQAGSHKKYGKVVLRTTKCYAHDDSGTLQEGEEVLIMETRPLSKLKRWRVVSRLSQSA